MKFPKKIYVKHETEDGAAFFVADANPASLVEMGEKIKIATYQLVEVVQAEGVASFSKPVKHE